MNYDESKTELVINDLSDANVQTGFFSISIVLDDGYNQVVETVIVDVRDPPVLEEPQSQEDPEEEAQ